MVVGEPGIGKTSLCQQLAAYVNEKDGQILIGHCYEEGSLSIPYLAFVEAMRSYVLERDADSVEAELGQSAADVARIVPEVRELLQIEPGQVVGAEDDRYRLLQAVTSFLRNAASAQPLAIVLEDLHDADKGTLDLLTYLSRNLTGARLLVIGTYRDVEVDRAHPLSGTLAELHRAASFRRIALRGLNQDEVRRLIDGLAGREVDWAIAEMVHQQTEGNPLFIQEVVRYLVEEGLLAGDGGAPSRTFISTSIPEGLRDVIGKRLSRLSSECNDLMRVAAVIGREFSLDVLEPVAAVAEDDLFRSLEEAAAAGLIEERTSVRTRVSYRFAHAFFRQTLYEEAIAPRRVRLHQRVGEAIEKTYSDRLEDHASELADHFTNGTALEDLSKAVAYGEMAARQAQSVYAYGEAARLLEQALQVQEVLDPDDKAKRCDLLLSLADALMPAGETRRVIDSVAPEAFDLAEGLGDRDRASRASQVALEAFSRFGGATATASSEFRRWIEHADRYAEASSRDRVFTNISMAAVELRDSNPAKAKALGLRGLEVALSLDDPEPLFMIAHALLSTMPTPPEDEADRWRLAKEVMGRPTVGVPPRTLGIWLMYAAAASMDHGERALSEELWGQLGRLAERTDDAVVVVRSMLARPWVYYLDGRLEEAIAAAEDLRARAEEVGGPGMGLLFSWFVRLRPLLNLGRGDEALAELLDSDSLTLPLGDEFERLVAVLSNAHLGHLEEAESGLSLLIADMPSLAEHKDRSIGPLLLLLECAVLIGDRDLCSVVAPRLEPVASLSTARFAGVCPSRQLGAAYALLGEPDKAREYYKQALEAAGKIRFRPEIALTHLQLAELLLDSYPDERSEAVEHLDFAVSELRDMKMQPALERAIELQRRLGSPTSDGVSYPDGLSEREVEVLRLMALGRTNRQIAAELFISASTVSHHVTSILNKTATSNRAEAAIYASRNDLA